MTQHPPRASLAVALFMIKALGTAIVLPLLGGCAAEDAPCDAARVPSRQRIECVGQFYAQAARPLSGALPGAFTVKTVVDLSNGEQVHFQDTATYPLHRAFAVAHLGFPQGAPFANEYYLPQRRYLLGAVTRYEEPDAWAYEIAPYDTATPEMVALAFRRLRDAAVFGPALRFHPTSADQEARLGPALSAAGVPTVTTDQLFAGTTYQPLNLGTTIGQVRILAEGDLPGAYVGPREIAVLPTAPEDISVVAGIVTATPQTPLSHINVLSQQRGTPNMALRDAARIFAPHAGRWVRLQVGAFRYAIEPVSQAEADAFWATHRPAPIAAPAPDYSRTGLLGLDALALADLPAVGGKAAHFAELRKIKDLRVPAGFAIPVSYYQRFLTESCIDRQIAALLADPRLRADGTYRRQQLLALQDRMAAAPVPADLLAALQARLERDFPGKRMRFRSSTTAEDLDGHSGAGLYESESGQFGDPKRPVDAALRKVWASLWGFRAFEERDHVSIDHQKVAMGVLVHPAYLDEAANGVALSANPFDTSADGEDAFYINAQLGETSVVSPPRGVTAEQVLYFYFHNGQPAAYLSRSSLVPAGSTVLSRQALFDLGSALSSIRDHFSRFYKPHAGPHLAMDVEFKLTPDQKIEIKQARPYPGRGHGDLP
jgi:hypothetical protein